MEKGAVLVILKGVIDFLVPDDTSVGRRDVDQFEPEGIPNQVVAQDCGALQSGVGPSASIGVSDVESGNSNRLDLVGGLWDSSFDRLFIGVSENGRHRGISP